MPTTATRRRIQSGTQRHSHDINAVTVTCALQVDVPEGLVAPTSVVLMLVTVRSLMTGLQVVPGVSVHDPVHHFSPNLVNLSRASFEACAIAVTSSGAAVVVVPSIGNLI